MTGLVLVVLTASACPAEQQPGWRTADGAQKRALFRACLDERRAQGEQVQEVKGVSDTRPPPPPPPPPFFTDPARVRLQTVSVGLSWLLGSDRPQLDLLATTVFPVAPAVWLGPAVRARKDLVSYCRSTLVDGVCELPRTSLSLGVSVWGRRSAEGVELGAGAVAGVGFTVQPLSGARLVAVPEAAMVLRLGFTPVVLEVSETFTSRTLFVLGRDVSLGVLQHGISVALLLDELPGRFSPGLSLGAGGLLHPGNGLLASTLVAEVSASVPVPDLELRPFVRGQFVLVGDRGAGPGVPWVLSNATGSAAFAFGGGVSGTVWRGAWGFGGSALALLHLWNSDAFPPWPFIPDGLLGAVGFELTAVPARWRFAGNTQDLAVEVGVSATPRAETVWWTPTARVMWSLHP